MLGSDRACRVIETIVKLAQQLQLDTIAEGVEEQKQLADNTRMSCDRIYGFKLTSKVFG